ncbi:MAG: FAD-dependent oxidoreductase [Gammaproteobacteria bacterium]|nr:FAD-dependent oxidoreductase [Gammaproteobacteria bacterium]
MKESGRRLDRRAVIGGIAAAGVGLVAGPVAGAASGAGAATSWDVIVIGGGFAGLTAARDLAWRGRRVLLLEARVRLGGRAFTSEFAGHRVDLGGTWVGLEQPFVWSERMRYGIGLAESAAFAAGERAIYRAGGRRVETTPQAYAELFAAGVRKFMAPAAEAFPRPFDPLYAEGWKRYDTLSAAEAIAQLRLTQPELDIVNGFASINGHTHTAQIGYLDQLKWYALGAFDPLRLFENCGRYRLEGGTQALLECIAADARAARAELRTATPVAAVVREGAGYRVVTDDAVEHVGRTVLVAVPLNTLARIRFEPGISADKLAASRERITGAGTKLYVKLKGPRPVFSAQGSEREALTFLWTEYLDADTQLAVGFGPDPKLLDINDSEAVQRAVEAYLPGAEVLDSAGYEWAADPYALSTWCMYRPGFFTKYFRELQRPEGGIHFAGSDIASGWRGFIDGAIETGVMSARRIDAELGA